MLTFAKNAAAALALTGLVLSQPALAVRSSDSLPAAKLTGMDRTGSRIASSEDVAGAGTIGLVIAALVAIGLILVVASDSGNSNQSPG